MPSLVIKQHQRLTTAKYTTFQTLHTDSRFPIASGTAVSEQCTSSSFFKRDSRPRAGLSPAGKLFSLKFSSSSCKPGKVNQICAGGHALKMTHWQHDIRSHQVWASRLLLLLRPLTIGLTSLAHFVRANYTVSPCYTFLETHETKSGHNNK